MNLQANFIILTLISLTLGQTSRPHPILPLIREGISKISGRERVNFFKSPYEGDLGGFFFLTKWRRAYILFLVAFFIFLTLDFFPYLKNRLI
jgi:hypothetical protein